jgi:hypothetical protein
MFRLALGLAVLVCACLDEAGKPEAAWITKSTGLPRYDVKVVTTMMSDWLYRPCRRC